LYELGFVLCLRADYAEALALAERANMLGDPAHDPVLQFVACTVQGHVHFLRGRPRAAQKSFESALTLIESLDRHAGEEPTIGDPRVNLLGLLAVELVDVGLIGQARRCIEEARARADQLARPMAQIIAFWLAALCEVRIGNADRVAELTKKMERILTQFPFPHGYVACRLFGGWAEARMGDGLSGYRTIRAAYEENLRLEMRAGSSETLGYAAEALLHAGELTRAAAQLEEALQIADLLGERVYLPQLYMIEAAIADGRGDADAARASILRALAEAREREASWLELLALIELCKRADATAEDRCSLAAIIDRLPEAGDTSAVVAARALLATGCQAR
jgi:tetratricopeptide (TPR) repeat protein